MKSRLRIRKNDIHINTLYETSRDGMLVLIVIIFCIVEHIPYYKTDDHHVLRIALRVTIWNTGNI